MKTRTRREGERVLVVKFGVEEKKRESELVKMNHGKTRNM